MVQTWKVAAQVVAAVALLVALAGPAHAALWLELDRAAAAPGATVTGRTLGGGALANHTDRELDLYLLPAARYGHIDRDDSGVRGVPQLPDELPTDAVALGVLAVDEAGDGHAAFVIPEVAPGDYLIAIYCPDCPRLPPLVTVEGLTVLTSATDGQLATTGSPLRLLTAALGLLLLSGAAVLATPSARPRASR